MASHRRPDRVVRRIVLRSAVAATLVAAAVSAGTLSFAQASSTTEPVAPAPAVATGTTVADLLPTPSAPDLDLPDVPLPDPEPATTSASGPSGHCDDPAWWNARQAGDPSDYVAACGEWPSWIDRNEDMPCLPGERNCSAANRSPGADPYTGPTVGRAWSPEYGYYEGRTDGPKNSQGEPCMQGRDNFDPNC